MSARNHLSTKCSGFLLRSSFAILAARTRHRFSSVSTERLSVSGQSRALVTLMDRLRLDLTRFVASGFARRSDARVAHDGTYFVRNAFAGQALAFRLLLGRVVGVLAHPFCLLKLLSRKFLGPPFELVTSLAHELVLSLRSWQQGSDCR